MAIVLMVFYFLAVVLDKNQKLKLLTGHVFAAAKRVFSVPDFGYYALGMVFQQFSGGIQEKLHQNLRNRLAHGSYC